MKSLLKYLNSIVFTGLFVCSMIGIWSGYENCEAEFANTVQLARAQSRILELTGGMSPSRPRCMAPGSGCQAGEDCSPFPASGAPCTPDPLPANPVATHCYGTDCHKCGNQADTRCIWVPGGDDSCSWANDVPCFGRNFCCRYNGYVYKWDTFGPFYCISGQQRSKCYP